MCLAFLGLQSLNLISEQAILRENSFELNVSFFNFHIALSVSDVFVLFIFFIFLLIFKNLAALFLFYKLSGLLTEFGKTISLSLFDKLLNVSPLRKKNLDKSETSAALTESIYSGVLQVVGQFVLFFSESLLMILMFIGLFIYKPLITSILIIIASLVYFFAFIRIQNVTYFASKNTSIIDSHTKNLVRESMDFSEVIYFQNSGHFFTKNFSKDINFRGANFRNLQTSQQLPKYFLDIIFLSSILIFAISQFFVENYLKGIEIFAVFFLVFSRMGPALLRAQSGLLAMKRGHGFSFLYFKTREFLDTDLEVRTSGYYSDLSVNKTDLFDLSVTAKDLVLNVPEIYDKTPDLVPFNFEFKIGDVVGISGPSGIGKSTLLETVSGLRNPQSGEILVSGYSPQNFTRLFPFSIFYSRQESNLLTGTILENVTFEHEVSKDIESSVNSLLKSVGLEDRINSLEFGIHSSISPATSFLSSGEEQRILIARALWFDAKIIMLDEATNALDALSEQKLIDLLISISRSRLIFIISHKVEVINRCTKVLKIG
jgi:ABC-type transport system involved in cytochrome bd biosynthesis fused ATPase/permease subunit